MKIGIWGYYGQRNVGDDLIMETLVTRIQEIREDAEIRIFVNPEQVESMQERYLALRILSRTTKISLKQALSLDVLIIGAGGLLPKNDTKKICFF